MVYPVAACRGRTNVGGSAFTPASLSNLAVWFDPSYGAFSDAGSTPAIADDPVRRWVARYPLDGSVYVEQATLANRPIYKQGANGKYYFAYNGSKLWSAASDTSTSSLNGKTFSFFGLVYSTSIASTQALFAVDEGGANRELGVYFFSSNLYAEINGGSVSTSDATALSSNTWYRAEVNYSTATQKVSAGINGGAVVASSGSAAIGSTAAKFSLGHVTAGSLLSGRMSHLIRTDSLPDSATKSLIQAFLINETPT